MTFTTVPYGKMTGLGTFSLADTNSHQVSSQAAREVWISADDANTGKIYVGSSSTVTNVGGGSTGIKLAAGQTAVMEVINANLVWVAASAATQKYTVLVFDA